jgi:hypothetical protein
MLLYHSTVVAFVCVEVIVADTSPINGCCLGAYFAVVS